MSNKGHIKKKAIAKLYSNTIIMHFAKEEE